MRNVGLFFGSFNPIHNGHLRLAECAYKQLVLDEVWFIVSPQNPLKKNIELASDIHRLRMAQLATADKKWVTVSDFEFSLPKPSYTITTLQKLTEQNPNKRFTLIIGADNLAVFHLWKNFDEILKNFTVAVYPRENVDLETLLKRYSQVKKIDAPLFPISSTQIREQIKETQQVENIWLHESVINYIEKEKLYLK